MSRFLRRAGLTASSVAALVGLAAILLWEIGRWRLTAMAAQFVPMAPITGVLFAALGLAGIARAVWPHRGAARRFESAASWFVIIVASWVFGNVWFGLPLPWEAWFRPPEMQVGPVPLGRIAPSTALALALTALSMLARGHGSASAHWVAVLSAGSSLGIGVVAILGFAVGAPPEYAPNRAPMALLTAVNLLFLNTGALLIESTVMRLRSVFAFGDTEQERTDNRRFALSLAGVAFMLVLLILSLGVLYLRNELRVGREAVNRELNAVANLKAADIVQWREERLGEARFLERTPHVASDIAAFLARPSDATARQRVIDWLEPIRGGTRYREVLLFDSEGRLRLSVPEGARIPAGALNDAEHPLGRTSTGLSDIHFPPGESRPHLDLVVPIAARGDSAKMATLVLEIDPAQYLYPGMATWPSISPTAEAYLVRKEGDFVVFLSPTRFSPGSALTTKFALDAPLLPEAKAARGEMGASGGLDYRGRTVLATARTIPNSTWILVSKIDQSEVYGPIRRQALETGLLFALIVLTIGLGAAHLWRERHAGALERGLAAERERAGMAERLSVVMREANDIILLADRYGRIVESNERARLVYGYSDEELRTMSVADLRADRDHDQFLKNLERLLSGTDVRFEAVHRRKDGSVLFVEASGRAIAVGGEPLVIVIYRDITERKAHEAQIERLNRLYASLGQVNQAVVRAADEKELLHDVCRALVVAGRFKMAWVGAVEPRSREVRCVASFGDEEGYLQAIRISIGDEANGRGPTGVAIRDGLPNVCSDVTREARMAPWREAAARSGFRSLVGLPAELGWRGRGALTVYASEADFFGAEEVALIEKTVADMEFGLRSIEEREKRQSAETELRDGEAALKEALRVGRMAHFRLDIASGQVWWSEELYRMLRMDPGTPAPDFEGHERFLAPESWTRAQEALAEVVSSSKPFELELEVRRDDGDSGWVLARGETVRDSAGAVAALKGVILDITERRRARAAADEARVQANRFSEALDRIPAYIYMKDLNRRYLYANKPTLDLFKCTAEEIRGRDDSQFFPRDVAARMKAMDLKVIDGQEDGGDEVQVPQADGTVRVHWVIKTPIYEDADRRRVCGLCGITTDITAVKEAEEALRQSEDRLRRLGDNLPDSYVFQYTVDKGTPRFLYVSNGIERVHGLKVEDVMRDASLYHAQSDPGQAAESQSAEEASRRTMTDFTVETKIRRTDGQIRWLQMRSRPRRSRDGRIIWDGVATDITNRKALEKMLGDHLEEVRARNEELSRFNRAMVDRELRMIELKHMVNALLARLGEPPRFVSATGVEPPRPTAIGGPP